MDSLITAAARALAAGDPLTALNQVALRDDAAALAMRGIALAQLGDLPRAGALLKAAGRAFGKKEALARARCVVARAEIALASRDLGWSEQPLERRQDPRWKSTASGSMPPMPDISESGASSCLVVLTKRSGDCPGSTPLPTLPRCKPPMNW